MAQVFEGGEHYFNALTSGTPHQGTIGFITGQFNTASSNLTDAGRRFYEQARVSVENAINSDAMRLAQAATRKLRSLWDEDCIRPLQDIGDFQYAPLIMQRYIMAQPTIRKLYQQQRCDGYSDTYIDIHPNVIGEDHYDYRRVMNGVVTISEEDEDGNSEWSSTTYLDELNEDDNELLFEEQLEIIQTWDKLQALLDEGKDDPTSRYNAELE
jgi:hypothetical protein